MTRHYADLGSASDWLKQISQAARPIRSTTQIWVVTRHQYGISVLQPNLIQKLFIRFFFASKSLENITTYKKMKAWNVSNHNYHTYLAWNSCCSRDIFGSLKVRPFRHFYVQEFSADTKLHELALQRGRLGRL